MRQVIGIGLLAGMGFTMSIFIATLGLDQSAEALAHAKVAILFASVIAGVGGYFWLRWAPPGDADESDD